MGICVESRPMSELAFVFAGFSVGLVVGLISDLIYTWIDPRIDFDRRDV